LPPGAFVIVNTAPPALEAALKAGSSPGLVMLSLQAASTPASATNAILRFIGSTSLEGIPLDTLPEGKGRTHSPL
jgi:hypothetical protein